MVMLLEEIEMGARAACQQLSSTPPKIPRIPSHVQGYLTRDVFV